MTKYVVKKDYPMRYRLMGYSSIIIAVIITTIISIPLVFLGLITNIFVALLATFAGELLTIILALTYVDQLTNWRKQLKLENFKWKPVLISVGIGIALYLLLQLLGVLLQNVAGGLESSDTSNAILDSSGVLGAITLFFFAPVVAPILEEMFFRGFVFGFIRKGYPNNYRKGLILGIIVNSVYFGAMHIQGFSTLYDFFIIFWTMGIAVINSILVWKTESLYPAVALHVSYNLTTVIAASIFM